MHLTIIRHGQSEGNAARLWQGRGNTALTEKGRSQAGALGTRNDLGEFDLVISSTLDRAIETARLAGYEPEPRAAFDEMNLGEWEGSTFEEVAAAFPEDLRAMRAGENVRWGRTGENAEEFNAKVAAGIDIIRAGVDDQARVLIVAHGGTNMAIIRHFLQPKRPPFHLFGPLTNTGVSRLVPRNGVVQLTAYNDAAHLGPVGDWALERLREGASMLDFVRHGVTAANKERRVQGQADWGLHAEGAEQARRLRSWLQRSDNGTGPQRVYTSSLQRAVETARLVYPDQEHVPTDGLMEIAMGEWQGRFWHELVAEFGEEMASMESGRSDIRRGRTGETFEQLQQRVTRTVEEIAASHRGERIALVSHGLALRSYFAGILGFGHDRYRALGGLANTALSRVVVTDDGPLITEFSVQYHLHH
jgi:broad specificity phosphatase PhoE